MPSLKEGNFIFIPASCSIRHVSEHYELLNLKPRRIAAPSYGRQPVLTKTARSQDPDCEFKLVPIVSKMRCYASQSDAMGLAQVSGNSFVPFRSRKPVGLEWHQAAVKRLRLRQ